MKTTNKFIALALVAVAMVFASCSKDKGEEPVVTSDYSKDILGMWEGVSMTGEETYGGAEARIAYHKDGECYIADDDTPEYDHWLQLTRYKRK